MLQVKSDDADFLPVSCRPLLAVLHVFTLHNKIDLVHSLPTQGLADNDLSLNALDRNGCSPLHVALLAGNVLLSLRRPVAAAVHHFVRHHHLLIAGRLACLRALLLAGADVTKPCEGSLPLHIAASLGSFPQQTAFSVSAVRLLLQHGAVPYERYVWASRPTFCAM